MTRLLLTIIVIFCFGLNAFSEDRPTDGHLTKESFKDYSISKEKIALIKLKDIRKFKESEQLALPQPIRSIEELQDRGSTGIGNGGNVALCENRTVFLDIAEGEVSGNGFEARLGDNSLNEYEKAEIAIARIGEISPELGIRLLIELDLFKKSSEFLMNAKLIGVEDSKHKYLPKDCYGTQQIAIHRENVLPGSYLYSIDNDLWKKLDRDNRAALIVHEIIYRLAFINGARDSIAIRQLNRLILSGKVNELQVRDYYQLMIATYLLPHAQSFMYHGYRLALTRNGFSYKDITEIGEEDFALRTYDDGSIAHGYVLSGFGGKEIISIEKANYNLGSDRVFLSERVAAKKDSLKLLPWLTFSRDAKIEKVLFAKDITIPMTRNFLSGPRRFFIQAGLNYAPVTLDADSKPVGGFLLAELKFVFLEPNMTRTLRLLNFLLNLLRVRLRIKLFVSGLQSCLRVANIWPSTQTFRGFRSGWVQIIVMSSGIF